MKSQNTNFTPMIEQYMKLKKQYNNIKDCILFYRLGDFYEMFFEDAKLVSKLLNLTLTKKKIGNNKSAPMCGVPYHSGENYINRLINLGYKIAICEQIKNNVYEDNNKKLLKREITRIITPGTFSSIENSKKNNFISSIYIIKNKIAIIFADVNTGQIYITNNTMNFDYELTLIQDEINKFNPSEIIINNCNPDYINIIKNIISDTKILHKFINNNVNNNILNEVSILKNNIILDEDYVLKCSVEQLLLYCNFLNLNVSKIFNEISLLNKNIFMFLNFSAVKNLELFECLHNKDKKNTLYSILDNTNTAMGSRLLKITLEKPLIDANMIRERNDFVEELINRSSSQKKITEYLKHIGDIQRLITKIIYRNVNGRDLINLRDSILYIKKLKIILSDFQTQYAKKLYNEIDILDNVFLLIDNSIINEPPLSISDGYIFKDNYNNDIIDLRNLAKGGRDKIVAIETKEKLLTGIKNLKISYNKIYGYFIEITNGNLNLIPNDRYIRKQTLSNCERYITNELKLHEFAVIESSFKLCELEYNLFIKLLNNIILSTKNIQKTALAISYIDIMNSFAIASFENNYVKPIIDISEKIVLTSSRHPIIEKLKTNLFISNDANLNTNKNRTILLTGPNMGGKSTYMRQIALIVIMAQIGCFVPATKAHIGIVDKIFTRIGASDNLVNGESTFMLEMKEVVDIIDNATKKSLIILDEVGRGTSTYDGIAMAQSILIYILKKIKAKTLFATHYHELTDLHLTNDGIKNCYVALKKEQDKIIFLYKIMDGSIKNSYGLEVAKLAGINDEIIKYAKKVLNDYEKNNIIK